MKIGDFLVVKKDISKHITCGDGVVGTFEIKKNEKYKITSVTKDEVEILYKDTTVWFSLTDVPYFLDNYKDFFYDFKKSNRKFKLEKIKNGN